MKDATDNIADGELCWIRLDESLTDGFDNVEELVAGGPVVFGDDDDEELEGCLGDGRGSDELASLEFCDEVVDEFVVLAHCIVFEGVSCLCVLMIEMPKGEVGWTTSDSDVVVESSCVHS